MLEQAVSRMSANTTITVIICFILRPRYILAPRMVVNEQALILHCYYDVVRVVVRSTYRISLSKKYLACV